MSAGQLARRRSTSSGSRSISGNLVSNSPLDLTGDLEPCAATASLFLFCQGSTIVVLHHDTLALDRRFNRHRDNIKLIAVDNVSERGAGRLVISYDTGQTAIIWDLFTGQEITRFASFEPIRVAAWMRNGNIAFGNMKGEVVLFEPSTSEHTSARTIFDPITAIAPAYDCQSFAIGYLNGSILIATLQPTFTILHTLTTARAPSPVISLAWHASSSKQKSDMLASQTVDGDLFVWSVAKWPSTEAPRIIRNLKRSEPTHPSPKWLSWSKNGRILQFSDGETLSYDVRTKHVTHDLIPTIQGVRGIANHGFTATIFTLGPNHTVQQYDVSNGAMVCNVQHMPLATDPNHDSVGSSMPEPALTAETLAKHTDSTPKGESQNFSASSTPTFEKMTAEMARRAKSPDSYMMGNSYVSTSRKNRSFQPRPPASLNSGTSFSTSSPRPSIAETLYSGHSMRYAPSVASNKSAPRQSKLRYEFISSVHDDPVLDLFPNIRALLNRVSIGPPRRFEDPNLGPDDLRKQMLSVIFGWDADINDLIRSEFSKHPAGTQHSVLLSAWLLQIDKTVMAPLADTTHSAYIGWMILALSSLGKGDQPKQAADALVQKLLSTNDIHAAAAILIGMGEGDMAVEVYVSRHQFLEAILLTCLLMPSEWARQTHIVRKWGDYAARNSQQHLALRCFSCTETDISESWASPSTQYSSYSGNPLSTSKTFTAPPPAATSPTSARLKTQSLKLITSFGPNNSSQFRFPGLASADRTPMNMPGVTPIDSALGDSVFSPGGFGVQRHYRYPGSALSARSTPSHRQRLPSIGESPSDVLSNTSASHQPLPSIDSMSGKNQPSAAQDKVEQRAFNEKPEESLEYLSPVRYTPPVHIQRATPTTALPADKVHDHFEQQMKSMAEKDLQSRNSSRSRKPDGMQIQVPPPLEDWTEEHAHQGSASSAHRHRRTGSDYAASPTMTAESVRSGRSLPYTARSIDQYISSLDGASYQAQKHKTPKKNSSKTKDPRGRSKQRYIQPAKRSPSSPIPMSPEDIALYSSNKNQDTLRTSSKTRDIRRHRSTSVDGKLKTRRSRSRRRDPPYLKSPSSPVPMSPEPESESMDEKFRFLTAERHQRYRSRERGRRDGRSNASQERRDTEPDTSDVPGEPQTLSDRSYRPQLLDGDTQSQRDRKELAAAELEARRQSLARRPSAPPIPHPGELLSGRQLQHAPVLTTGHSLSGQKFTSNNNGSPGNSDSNSSGRVPCTVPIGLPATPRAMRHPKYSTGYTDFDAPAVPELPSPDAFYDRRPSIPLPRSMSAPIPDLADGMPTHPHFQRQLPSSRISRIPAHRRESSNEVIIGNMEGGRWPNEPPIKPPLLPELQHLQMLSTPPAPPPPPPPPPPAPIMIIHPESNHDLPTHGEERNSLISGVGTINIAIDGGHGAEIVDVMGPPTDALSMSLPDQQQQFGQAPASKIYMEPHRRGQSVNDNNISSKFRTFTDRMRNPNRAQNARSPPPGDRGDGMNFPPYEAINMNSLADNKF
ncbi:hypothetical protein FQN57_000219 [Myotisia sp. PD_48]|nr:hypothetical protein FQN57_000219 [Myotisia sp. PD_48]